MPEEFVFRLHWQTSSHLISRLIDVEFVDTNRSAGTVEVIIDECLQEQDEHSCLCWLQTTHAQNYSCSDMI